MAANKACTATHHNSLLSRNNLMLDTIRRRHAHRISFYWFYVNGVSPVIQISKQTPQYISSLCTEWSGRSEWLAAARSCCNTCTSPNSSPPSSFECSPAPFGSARCLYCSPSRPATSTPHSPIPRLPSEYPLRCRLQNQYRANGPAYHWYPPTPAPELHVNKVFLHVVQIRVRLLGQILRIVVHMRNQLVPALLGCHFKKKRTWLGGFLRSSRRCCRSSSTVKVETMAPYLLTLQPLDHVLSSLHFTIVPAPSQHHPRKSTAYIWHSHRPLCPSHSASC